jgi:hypothetical protein
VEVCSAVACTPSFGLRFQHTPVGVDELYGGFHYIRRSPLALLLKVAKGLRPGDRIASTELLLQLYTSVHLPLLVNLRTQRGLVGIVPIPGCNDLTVAMANALAANFASTRTIVTPKTLQRMRYSVQTKDVALADRRGLVGGLLQANQAQCLPEVVILVDDVVTTGASLAHAANLVRCRGARRVLAVVLFVTPVFAQFVL